MQSPWPTIGDMDVDDKATWTYLRRVGQGDCALPPPAKATRSGALLGQRPSARAAGLKSLPQGHRGRLSTGYEQSNGLPGALPPVLRA